MTGSGFNILNWFRFFAVFVSYGIFIFKMFNPDFMTVSHNFSIYSTISGYKNICLKPIKYTVQYNIFDMTDYFSNDF